MDTKSVFATLNAINCNEHTETKNGLTYLSWAWAWQIVKQHYPTATYTIYESEGGIPYFSDGRTAWVKTGVTIEGLEHIEYLPIMDFRNNSIPVDKVTSMDMNKAIQRSLTKAVARQGLGLYIYAGEDIPSETADVPAEKPKASPERAKKPTKKADVAPGYTPMPTEDYIQVVKAYAMGRKTKTGGDYKQTWIEYTHATDEAILKFDQDVADFRLTL